jgi:hypothetical protein
MPQQARDELIAFVDQLTKLPSAQVLPALAQHLHASAVEAAMPVELGGKLRTTLDDALRLHGEGEPQLAPFWSSQWPRPAALMSLLAVTQKLKREANITPGDAARALASALASDPSILLFRLQDGEKSGALYDDGSRGRVLETFSQAEEWLQSSLTKRTLRTSTRFANDAPTPLRIASEACIYSVDANRILAEARSKTRKALGDEFNEPGNDRYSHELYLANLAWREVRRSPNKTVKQSLAEFLENKSADPRVGTLNPTQISRITDVVNWDKSPGRPEIEDVARESGSRELPVINLHPISPVVENRAQARGAESTPVHTSSHARRR